MIRFKPEVRIGLLTSQLYDVLFYASVWSCRTRLDVEINSVEDGPGVHMASSLHYSGLAVDLDTAGDKEGDTRALAEYLRRALPTGYDVVFEGDHVHVEYDMKRPPLRKAVT